jgi:hypothetical protein
MKRLIRAWGGADHRDAVKDRVRGLMSVTHEVDEVSPHAVRSKLNGGRSELAGAARIDADA